MLEIQAELERLRLERAESEAEAQAMRAKKQNMKLQLGHKSMSMSTSTSTNEADDVSKSDTYETCDTFHTAQSNFSLVTSPTITEGQQSPLSNCSCEAEDEAEDTRKDDLSGSSEDASRTCTAGPSSGSGSGSAGIGGSGSAPTGTPSSQAIMSDSGVCLDNRNQALLLQNGLLNNYRQGVRTSDEDTGSCSSCELGRHSDVSRPYCPLHSLRRKIAAQKALIMKNLETDLNKAQLDEHIADLQDLQRRYIQMEQEMLQSVQDLEAHAQCCADERSGMERQYELASSIMRSSVMSPTSMEESTSQIYSPSMTRSCPSMREFRKCLVVIELIEVLTGFLMVSS